MTFKETSIVLGEGLAQSNLLDEACSTKAVVLISDENVAKLYGEALRAFLQGGSREVYLITFPSGEASKTRHVKASIEDQMLAKGLGKETTVLAIGGGVTTDLAGFIASTYCRGIPLVLMPTSLLAMVDASLGGKTGVNTEYGKNLIGSYYLPKTLIIDYDFLKTLPEKDLKEGLVEIIKIALVYDESLFNLLEKQGFHLFKEQDLFKQVIAKACGLKLEVVKQDFDESQGLRHILNFGHTVGHALERFFNYEMSHGVAVALGMIAESFIATEAEILDPILFNRIVKLLTPFISKVHFDIPKVYENMLLDKKVQNKLPRFVCLSKLGKVDSVNHQYCIPIEKNLIYQALQYIQEL